MDNSNSSAPLQPEGGYSFDAFRRRLDAAQPGQYPAFDDFRKEQAKQQLADQDIDPEQLRGDEWDAMRPAQAGIGAKIAGAIARGGMGAWNGVVRGVTTGVLKTGQFFGRAGLEGTEGRTPEQEVQKYFSTPFNERNTQLTISDETISDVAGPSQGGLYGILEGLTEFGVEFVAAGGALKLGGKLATKIAGEGASVVTAVGKAAKTFDATTLGAGAIQGALAQYLFQDPYAARVSNLIAESPPEISSPLLSWINAPIKGAADALKADPLDSKGKAEMKSLLEGYLLGMPFAVAGAVLGASIKKIARGVEEGTFTKSEAEVLLKEAQTQYADEIAAGQATAEAGPAKVVDLPDGQKQVEANDVPGPTLRTDLEASNAKAAIDAHHEAARIAHEPLSPDDVARFRDRVKALDESASVDDYVNLLEEAGINKRYLTSPKDAIEVIKALADTSGFHADELRAKPTTNAETIAKAKELFPGLKAKMVQPVLKRLGIQLESAPAVMTAARAFIVLQSREVKKLSMLVSKYPGNGALENHLIDAVQALHGVHAEFVGANASVGRTLQVNKIESKKLAGDFKSHEVAPKSPEAAAAKTPDQTPKQLSRKEAMELGHVLAMGRDEDAEGMLKLLAAPSKAEVAAAPEAVRPKLMQKLLAARVEFILSSPKTQAVNIISSMHRLLQNPAELALTGTKEFAQGQGTETLHQAWDLVAGQMMSTFDALRFTYKSFMDGTPILDPGNFIPEQGSFGMKSLKEGVLEGPWSAVQTLLLRMPGRTLMASDEFFNQILYRSRARMDVLAKLRGDVEHGIIKAEDMGAVAEQRIAAMTDDAYRGIYAPALDYARDSTYKTTLTGFPRGFQELANSHPVGRFFFPFVRTPYNIFDYVWQSTPGLNAFNKRMQEAIAEGGTAAKHATARAEFGTMLYGLAAYLAASGTITGGGPSDPKIAKTWRKFNQPYSFKLADGTFISYRRGDTFFAPLGIMADFWAASGGMEEQDRVSTAAALTSVFTANALNRSYMSNVDTLFAAMSSKDGGDKMSRLMGTAAGSFVPSVVKDVAITQDPYERELVGIWDSVKARTPGFTTDLEPQMNLFGEPVLRPPGFLNAAANPFTIWPPRGDLYVNSELDKLGRNLPGLPETMAHGMIDLRSRTLGGKDGKAPITRWYELMAEGKPNLRDTLTKVIKSDAWDKLSGTSAYDPGGQKYLVASKLIEAYRQKAWAKLLSENKALRQAYIEETQIEAAGASGVEAAKSKADDIRQLGGLIHRNR